MRILCVTAYYKPAYIYGGPTRCISTLCEGLVKAGDEVTVFTTDANGDETLPVVTGKPVCVDGVNVVYYPVTPRVFKHLPFYFYSPDLTRACISQTHQFNIVYAPGTWTHAFRVGANAAVSNHVPFIVTPHGNFMNWSMQQKAAKKKVYLALVERRLINQAAAIHLTSELEARQIQKMGFTPRMVTIPNGIDLGPYRVLPERGRLRGTLGLRPDDRLSLFVGRLHKEKRPSLLIEAFAEVAGSDAQAHFLVVGPDQDGSGEQMRAAAQQAGIPQRVHFTGLLEKDDLLQAYADADLLVLLSHRENFGMVLVEGMAAGLPVLVSDEVGLAVDIQESGAGIVVKAEPTAVTQEWSRLTGDADLRAQMGSKGRRLVEERFSAEVVLQQMHELFRSVSGTR